MLDENVENTETLEVEETETQETETPTRGEKKFQNDLFRWKKEAKTTREENEALKEQMKQMEQKTLLGQSKYKEAFENSQKEIEELKNKLDRNTNAYFSTLKNSAIKTEALKSGIREEALQDLALLDTSDVEVEVTNLGNTNVRGQSEFIQQLKAARPHWFTTKTSINFNENLPNNENVEVKDKELKPLDILKLQKENPKKYRELMHKRLRRV